MHRAWSQDVETQVNSCSGGSGHTRVRCPACPTRAGKTDYARSLSVNMGNGWWKCHRCGWRGRLSWMGGDEWVDEEPDAQDVDIEQPSDYQPITRALAMLTTAPHRYLLKRRIPSSVVKEARIGYAMSGDHRGRIILPAVASPDWRHVGWTGRMAQDAGKRRRYHQAEGMDTRSTFYNDDQLGEDGPLVVVEGPFDALAHWPRAVGCWGKPRNPQLERLANTGRPVIWVGDADAWRDFVAAAMILRSAGADSWAVRLPTGMDPHGLSRKCMQVAIDHCIANKTDTDLQ